MPFLGVNKKVNKQPRGPRNGVILPLKFFIFVPKIWWLSSIEQLNATVLVSVAIRVGPKFSNTKDGAERLTTAVGGP